MLKYIFIYTLLIINAAAVHSQTLIGVKAGANFSQLLYQQINQRPPVQTYKTGYTGGLVIKYYAQPHVGIQGEVNYSQKGWLITQDANIHEKSLDYIEIPVMTNIYLGKKKTQVFLNLGPYIAFLVNESDKETINTVEGKYIFEGRAVKEFDYGLNVGAGFNHAFSFGTIQVEGRFSQGLNNLIDSFGTVEQTQGQVLNVSLAYFYKLW